MESLWEWLAGAPGAELGRASGDEILLAALLEAAESTIASSGLRPAVAAVGCQADPTTITDERVERLAEASPALCRVACAPTCGAATVPVGDGHVEIVSLPTLHQTDTGPVLVALDRRAGFGFALAARRLDLPFSPWRATTFEIVWTLSPEIAAAAMRQIAGRLPFAGADAATPRALLFADESTALSAPSRPRIRSRAKPGAKVAAAAARAAAAAAAAAPPDDGTGREVSVALASRLLAELQTAAALEGALCGIADALWRSGDVDEKLDAIAAEIGRAVDASRATVVLQRQQEVVHSGALDEAPTAQLTGQEETHQGVYTRIDTRRLHTYQLDRAESGAVLARLVRPIARDETRVGEVRLLDSRPTRAWSALERRFVDRAALLVAAALASPAGGILSPAPNSGGEEGVSDTDRLTGLEPRAAFERRLRDAVDAAGRSGEFVALVRLKIDRLAEINEIHGYAAGDAVIRHVAGVLRAHLAEDEDSAFARFGGEGFAVLLPGFTHVAATRVAEHLASSVLATPLPTVGAVTVLVGVATFPDSAATPEELASLARARMLGAP